ncbi:MAG: hypothetical protein ABFS17_05485 [Chloroflexota bacterium]
MKSKITNFYRLGLLMILLTLFGCGKDYQVPLTTPTEDFSGELQLLPTWTIEITPTISPTASVTPTITLQSLPTLQPEEKIDKYVELMETNADCKLPCWWGFHPGETDWEKAKQQLETIAYSISQNEGPRRDVRFRVPEYISPNDLSHRYYIEEGIISIIMIQHDSLPVNTVSDILNEYGKPDEVFLRISYASGRDDLPVGLILFYEDHGFRVSYGIQGTELTDSIRACFPNDLSGGFILWYPENLDSYNWIMEYIAAVVPDKYFLIEELTDLNIDTFYNLFSQNNNEVCIFAEKEKLIY